jgi:hypothetical protein
MPDSRFLDFETFGLEVPIDTEADVNGAQNRAQGLTTKFGK